MPEYNSAPWNEGVEFVLMKTHAACNVTEQVDAFPRTWASLLPPAAPMVRQDVRMVMLVVWWETVVTL